MRRTGSALLAAALFAAGCGGDSHPAPDSALGDQCDPVPSDAKRVTLTAPDGARLGAALVGRSDARVGVVLSQGASQTLCDWLPIAEQMAAIGAQVLVVDRRATGSSPGPANLVKEPGDVRAAANWLSQHGAANTMLLGSSLGSLSAFIAASPDGPVTAAAPPDRGAPALTVPACGVLLVSPLNSSSDGSGSLDALAVRTWPSKLWVAYEKDNPTIAEDAARIVTRVQEGGGTAVRQVAVPGRDHSIALVRGHAEIRALLDDAVRACR